MGFLSTPDYQQPSFVVHAAACDSWMNCSYPARFRQEINKRLLMTQPQVLLFTHDVDNHWAPEIRENMRRIKDKLA
jgi:hypothetical protein